MKNTSDINLYDIIIIYIQFRIYVLLIAYEKNCFLLLSIHVFNSILAKSHINYIQQLPLCMIAIIVDIYKHILLWYMHDR